MAGQSGQSTGVECVLRSNFGSSTAVELVRKTDTIGDLRTEFKPIEIEINAESYFAEVVGQVQQYRFLVVAADVKAGAATGYDVRTVVSFAGSRPFEVERQIHRDSQHIDIGTFAVRTNDGIARFGLITERAARELQTRAETQVEILA